MKFIDLKEIVRKDSPIHYINEYHARIFYSSNGVVSNSLIEIVLEKTAFGTTNTQIHFDDNAPVELKENLDMLTDYIDEKYKDGYFKE